ncbi:hypothetical protein EON65_15735 [archaeon]|nr:MAG: hypothetical protein EON65_15735 [archaeon]
MGIQGVIMAKMKSLAVPIPETFVISTTATEEFFRTKDSSNLLMKCRKAVGEISRHTGRRFEQTRPNLLEKVTGVAGSDEKRSERPLLLSFRAVPDFPMPDVMETLTSIGMNTDLLNQLAHDKESAVWAHETYTQFLQTWGTVIEGHDHARFAEIIREVRARAGILQGQPLDLDTLKLVIHEFKRLVNPPEDPVEQLKVALETICNNWYGSRSDKFKDLFGLEKKLRLAIIVQHMVYGNYDNKSGSGVGFSRNPVNGDTDHIAEFLPMATRFELLFQEVEPLHLSHLRNFKPEVFYKMQHVLKLHETNFKDAHVRNSTIFHLSWIYFLIISP